MSVDNGSPAVYKRGYRPPGGESTVTLTWSEVPEVPRTPPPVRYSATNDSHAIIAARDESPAPKPTIRMHQPAGGMSTIKFGEKLSAEEAEALLKSRPASDLKKREMNGSGIFNGAAAVNGEGNGADRTAVRMHQPAGGISQIAFGVVESASPKKPVTIPEVAKQKELSGTRETTDDIHHKRGQFSNAKAKELVGSNIFGPPPPEVPKNNRSLEMREESKASEQPQPRSLHTSVKISNPAGGRSQISFGGAEEEAQRIENVTHKLSGLKSAELSGHDIFSDANNSANEKAHQHHLSQAKLKEITGHDIFSDDKPRARDVLGGIKKPPGGVSSIALV
ncbi:hypothetical protein KC19_11G145200 [Ceratodon purpureus]|uniref:DUF4057 domain-containing protein n=1 Tax=Ceratodon purpureus TaxID=3225 RepID=A0A8T0GG76_CERPU|nr:hypothetical protein KC19_11G145200 [Ceratodon purpureus]